MFVMRCNCIWGLVISCAIMYLILTKVLNLMYLLFNQRYQVVQSQYFGSTKEKIFDVIVKLLTFFKQKCTCLELQFAQYFKSILFLDLKAAARENPRQNRDFAYTLLKFQAGKIRGFQLIQEFRFAVVSELHLFLIGISFMN